MTLTLHLEPEPDCSFPQPAADRRDSRDHGVLPGQQGPFTQVRARVRVRVRTRGMGRGDYFLRLHAPFSIVG